MNKQKDILNLWGTADWKYFSNTFPLIISYFLIVIVPYDYRALIIGLLSVAIIPTTTIMIINARKSIPRFRINIEKISAFLIVINLEFLHIDEFRLAIFTLLLAYLYNLPFLKYDIYKSRALEIIAKLSFSNAFAIFLTMTINLSILLLKITSLNK